ncbi:VacJ family lipoprotein [Terricaulis sp.]|uniref:MlaA family lipoprotein n=1 Tax=Terricaulis sp. TaxID=2768686 RepID=UPI002ADDC6D9|nr:VacJ family lipoprotein [Terricaulis sp.]
MRGSVSVLAFAACLAAPTVAFAQDAVSDPWEGANRGLFAVHEGIDQAVLEPVARGYRAVTPRPVRTGVLNFIRNLRGPVIFANDVLQGEFERAGTTAARFGVNTTIGIVGVFDPASSMGLERHDEDFGQTLAVWGVAPGPYLFIPVLGPSNLRDTTGRVVDMVFDPLNWARGEEAETARMARGILTGLAAREQVLETIDDIRANSIDPYATIRASYGQLRDSAIENGRTDVQDLPDFEDITDADAPGGDTISFLPPDEEYGLAYYVLDNITGEAS